VDALRRLSANVVDVVGTDGAYYRALTGPDGIEMVSVRAVEAGIELRATGPNGDGWATTVERILGTRTNLKPWYERSRHIAWLAPIAAILRGLKPPRYPTLWEACAHAIVFQQISIHAAAAIMRRAVERLGESVSVGEVRCVAFPGPQRWLAAREPDLRAVGISANKIAHLRAAAEAFGRGEVQESALELLPTPLAAQRLQCIRGIGAWSAAVILLRGLGRLDTFPLRDSGVARSLRELTGGAQIDVPELLERLGPVRGMLYYHLLLARMRHLTALNDDSVRGGAPHERRKGCEDR